MTVVAARYHLKPGTTSSLSVNHPSRLPSSQWAQSFRPGDATTLTTWLRRQTNTFVLLRYPGGKSNRQSRHLHNCQWSPPPCSIWWSLWPQSKRNSQIGCQLKRAHPQNNWQWTHRGWSALCPPSYWRFSLLSLTPPLGRQQRTTLWQFCKSRLSPPAWWH